MNCEVKPFQDCKSVTIDELKGHTSELLNQAAKDQQPLRVTMKDGKELLLFPQELLAPFCDNDFCLIVLSAMRYAMGRNTYMPLVVTDYIKRHIRLLDDKFLVLAANDIRRHFEDYGEYEPNPELWKDLLGELETEQRDRIIRPAKKSRDCPVCGTLLEIKSITDNEHSPNGFDVIAHCESCNSDYMWFCYKDGVMSEMKKVPVERGVVVGFSAILEYKFILLRRHPQQDLV